jgi:hypothetical protein
MVAAGNALAGGDAVKARKIGHLRYLSRSRRQYADCGISTLGGQPDDYLKGLARLQIRQAQNPLMGPQAQNLSKQDMKDLAAYFSRLSGDLKVKY